MFFKTGFGMSLNPIKAKIRWLNKVSIQTDHRNVLKRAESSSVF